MFSSESNHNDFRKLMGRAGLSLNPDKKSAIRLRLIEVGYEIDTVNLWDKELLHSHAFGFILT